MDDPAVDAATLAGCLRSLATVNRLSLGYRPTLRFVDRLAARVARRPLRLLDVGSGYGDTPRAVARRCLARGVAVEVLGVDLNPHAVALATAATAGLPVRFAVADARTLDVAAYDAVTCSLFAHHLEDAELVAFLCTLDRAPAFFVNDLYRSRFAASAFRVLAAGMHPFVRDDGPVSFARAFRRPDWERLLAAAGVRGARIFLGAPYRLCVERL